MGYSLSQYGGGVHASIWDLKSFVKSVFGVCENNIDKNSLFRVHKSEEMKNSAIWLDLFSGLLNK